MLPVEARLRSATAMLAEKYRRYPTNDPLYILAHQVLPPKRLKLRSSWQYLSDEILKQAGFDPSRNDNHIGTNDGLISLAPHSPYHFVSHIERKCSHKIWTM